MADRIDFIVCALERGEDERAALETLGIPDGGDRDVDGRAISRKGGQGRRYEHGSGIVRLDVLALHVHAKALEHIGEGVFGEGRIPDRIARPIQVDHDAIADQVILPDTFDIDHIPDAGLGFGRGEGPEKAKTECGGEECFPKHHV